MTAVLGSPVEDYPQEMVSQDTTSDEQWEINDGYNAYQESFPQGDFYSATNKPIEQDFEQAGEDSR